MLRRDRQLRTQVHQVMDAALFAIALWMAHLFRQYLHLSLPGVDPIRSFEQYVWLYLIIIPVAPLLLETQGFYNRPVFASRWSTFWPLLRSCSLMTLGVVAVLFLVRTELARGVIILFGIFSFLVVWMKEELVRHGMKSRFGQSQFKRRYILIGTKEETAGMHEEMRQSIHDEMEILAELDLNETSPDKLLALLHEHSVNGVIINAKHTLFGHVEKAIQACELEGVEAWLVADFFKTQISRTTVDEFHGRPVLVFRSTPEASWQALAKQLLDVIGAFFLLVVFSPLLVGVAILIRVTSPGPIFFRQQRSGLNGHPFTMYKFRSMITDAEQRKQELEALNEMDGPVFKVTNDPRITPIGKWLRKTSLDEFPQLLNVLRGEMSLVGPRPLPVDEVKRFDDVAHRRRLSVKPGLTCLWQISGRNNVTNFKDWVALDLEYIDNWSFWLDLKILWRTIPVVLLAKGAK